MSSEKQVKKNYRDSEGAVIIQPKNFLTSNPKRGNPATTLGVLFTREGYSHIPDPYDRLKELTKKDRLEHYKKMQERNFFPSGAGGKTFNNDNDLFSNEEILKRNKQRSETRTARPPHFTQEVAFKPSHPVKRVSNQLLTIHRELTPPLETTLSTKEILSGSLQEREWTLRLKKCQNGGKLSNI
jgi:hypothetical protein